MRPRPKLNREVFSARVRRARSAKHYTGEKVAELCNINDSYYRKVECGHRDPSLALVLDLCTALDVSPDYLLGYIYSEPDSVPENDLSREDQALVKDITYWLESRLGMKKEEDIITKDE